MKKFLLILATMGVLVGCALENASNITPDLWISELTACHHESDTVIYRTLRYRIDSCGYVFDTIQVGDSVRFQVLLQAHMNLLDSFEVKHNEAMVSLTPSKLNFDTLLANAVSFWINYTPVAPGFDTIQMTVVSNAQDVPNWRTYRLIQPVVAD